jgi:hypothetical protein
MPFASNDIITRYQPNPRDHGKSALLSRQKARAVSDQRWIVAKDGNYVAGLHPPERGLGGGSMANDNGGPYNARVVVHKDRLDHIYLQVKPGHVIRPGQEIFINYGSGRAVAMGDARMGDTRP